MTPSKPETIVRVTGALKEDLEGVGETTLGKPFEVSAAFAARVLKDGTNRFRRANPAEARSIVDEEKAKVDARLKAANTPPKERDDQ